MIILRAISKEIRIIVYIHRHLLQVGLHWYFVTGQENTVTVKVGSDMSLTDTRNIPVPA